MSEYPYAYDRQGKPIDRDEMVRLFEEDDGRIVEQTRHGDVLVSTVHIVIDHGYGEGHEPLIFETMIFGGEHSDEQWRYSTEEQARAGHAAACRLAFGADPEKNFEPHG